MNYHPEPLLNQGGEDNRAPALSPEGKARAVVLEKQANDICAKEAQETEAKLKAQKEKLQAQIANLQAELDKLGKEVAEKK